MKEPEYRIWITYHKDSLVEEYGLKEDANHKLFAVHKPVEGENMNCLNPVYSEFCTLYYVWQNRKKTPYVGFNHYRRQFDVRRLPGEGECQVWKIWNLKRHSPYWHYCQHHNPEDMDCIIDILNREYGEDNSYVKHLKRQSIFLPCVCFLMAWDDFVRMCEFVFPIMFEFAEKTGCRNDLEKWREKEIRDFNTDDEKKINYQMRIQGFLAERLVSAWIFTHLKYYVNGPSVLARNGLKT